MRKINRVYTEDTYHGEAPTLDTPEGKAIIAENADLRDSKVLLEEIPDIIENIKADASKTELNAS